MVRDRRWNCLIALAGVLLLAGCREKQEAAAREAGTGGTSATEARKTPAGPQRPAVPHTPRAPESASPPHTNATPGGASISVAGLTFTVPDDWTEDTPGSPMRVAQYSLPGEAGAAELVVFYFGVGGAGPTQANIDRWVGQLRNPDDPHAPAEHETDRFEQNGLTISTARVKGTYAPPAMGPMAPAARPQEGYALHGIVVEGGPQGSVFVKVTGPEATVTAQRPAIESFTRSARVAR